MCTANGNNLLKLTLTGQDVGAGPLNLVLQDDKALPASRTCASDYEVSKVIVKGDALAVFVRYSSPGFEGPDIRSIVVTEKQDLP